MQEPASIKDVAARAGVSVGTVSNVINRPQIVRAATRSRVEAAMSDLGFVRNESARQLRAGSSRVIAYLFLDASNPYFIDVARGAELRCREEQFALVMCTSDGETTREDDYLSLLHEQRVRGVLVTPVNDQGDRLRSLPRLGIPVVLVDRTGVTEGDWCTVGTDDVRGGELAVGHLLEQGHEQLAFVGGRLSVPQVAHRLQGAARGVAAAGLPTEALAVLETDGTTVAAGREAAQRLLGLPASNRPTAAVCANDLLALGVLQELMRQGVRVPEDVAIVGYDDIEFAAAAAVPLSSVRQPREQLGRTAVDLLLREAERIADHRHEHVEFTPELVVRESSHGRRTLPR